MRNKALIAVMTAAMIGVTSFMSFAGPSPEDQQPTNTSSVVDTNPYQGGQNTDTSTVGGNGGDNGAGTTTTTTTTTETVPTYNAGPGVNNTDNNQPAAATPEFVGEVTTTTSSDGSVTQQTGTTADGLVATVVTQEVAVVTEQGPTSATNTATTYDLTANSFSAVVNVVINVVMQSAPAAQKTAYATERADVASVVAVNTTAAPADANGNKETTVSSSKPENTEVSYRYYDAAGQAHTVKGTVVNGQVKVTIPAGISLLEELK